MKPKPSIILLSPMLPEYNHESGSRRIFHMIEMLVTGGWLVTYVSGSTQGGAHYIRHLQQMGVLVYGADVYSDPAPLLAGARFDLALMVFWYTAEHFLPILRVHSPETLIGVDSVDLHLLRKARMTFVSEGRLLDEAYADEMIRELNVYRQCDFVLTVSEKEATFINDFMGMTDKAHVVKDYEAIALSPVERSERRGILFLGNFRHPPNVEGVLNFLQNILPEIPEQVLKEHPFTIVGTDLPLAVMEPYMRDYPDIRAVGWVPSVIPYIHQACVMVIPLLTGAGTKRKVIQGLMAGTPLITTRIGAEGFELVAGQHALIEDEAASFAGAVAGVIREHRLWHVLAREGRLHILKTHGKEVIERAFMALLGRLLSGRQVTLGGSGGLFKRRFRLGHIRIDMRVFETGTGHWMVAEAPLPDEGFCNIRGEATRFSVYGDNLRETLVAESGSFNRQRQLICGVSMALFDVPHGTLAEICEHINAHGLKVYMAEANGSLFEFMREHIQDDLFYFSEYFGTNYVPGDDVGGIRHEDVQALSFEDGMFDLVLTSEVMEHVPDAIVAEREIVRVLKVGGLYCFTVPIHPLAIEDDIYALKAPDGEIIYLKEPVFHADPLRPDEGALVFRIFSHMGMRERFRQLGCTYTPYWFESLGLGIVNRASNTVQIVRKVRGGV